MIGSSVKFSPVLNRESKFMGRNLSLFENRPMNNIKIHYDGRVVVFPDKKKTPHRFSEFAPNPNVLTPKNGWGDELFFDLSNLEKALTLKFILGFSHVTNSRIETPPTVRARRGTKGITSLGKSTLRQATHYLEDRYGRTNLAFFTGTLPPEYLEKLQPKIWSRVVDEFTQNLRAHLERAGLCTYVVGCTEIQTKRGAETDGIPPLHVHLVFQGRHPGKHWAGSPSYFKRLWQKAVQSQFGFKGDFKAATRIEPVKRSAVAYLAKYISKGEKDMAKFKTDLLPSSWWTCTRELVRFVRSRMVFIRGEWASSIRDWLKGSGDLAWDRDVWSPETVDGDKYLFAWVGQLADRETYFTLAADLQRLLWDSPALELAPMSCPI